MEIGAMGNENFEVSAGGGVVEHLNSLLRGEISAAETYKMAIDSVAGSSTSQATKLRSIQEEHGRTAQQIRARIRQLGGEADNSSGSWGAWARTFQGTLGIFGDASAIKSLKEGEEHGLKDYQQAIDDVDAVSRQMIQNQFIPAQERHIYSLDQMIRSDDA